METPSRSRPPSRCTCLNTSSLDGRECPRVKDPARIRSCVTRSGEIVGVGDEVVVNDGEEEEQAWKSSSQQAMMNTNGNNDALVVSPPGKSMMMMMMLLFSSSVAEYYRCSDEEFGRNCLRCFVLHSIKVKKLQRQLGALVLCS